LLTGQKALQCTGNLHISSAYRLDNRARSAGPISIGGCIRSTENRIQHRLINTGRQGQSEYHCSVIL
ncbi:MAG: hypothetical protein WA710_22605, partial [Pseudolabrys sp.]